MIPHCHTEDHQSSDFISIAKLWNFIPPCSQCCSPVTVPQWLAQADMVNVSLYDDDDMERYRDVWLRHIAETFCRS